MKALAWTVGVVTAGLVGLMVAGQRMDSPADGMVKLDATPTCSAYTDQRARMTREEFRRMVEGATPERLCGSLGSPARTSQHGDIEYWYYRGLSYDAATGRPDVGAQLRLRGGTVEQVNF